jgi:hypothetical protein
MSTSEPRADASGAPVEIDARIEAAIARGRVRVLVELRIAGGIAPEGELGSAERVAAQRRAIATAQSAVLSRLAGTDFALVRRFDSVPLLTLQIGPTALAALRTMADVVARVVPETLIPPAGGSGASR